MPSKGLTQPAKPGSYVIYNEYTMLLLLHLFTSLALQFKIFRSCLQLLAFTSNFPPQRRRISLKILTFLPPVLLSRLKNRVFTRPQSTIVLCGQANQRAFSCDVRRAAGIAHSFSENQLKFDDFSRISSGKKCWIDTKIQRICFSVMSSQFVYVFKWISKSFCRFFCGLNFVRVLKFVFTCQPLC